MTNKNPFDSASWHRAMMTAAPRYRFDADNRRDALRWQRNLRRRFIDRLGGFPSEAVPLSPRTLSKSSTADCTRAEIGFTSRPSLAVFAHYLLPKSIAAPLPAIICLPGHGSGVDPLVGLDSNGKPVAAPDYHNTFALEAVRRGYAVLAIEILGFGRRREGDFEPGSGASSCLSLSGAALMLGDTMAGWRVYDAMRAIDYLQSRPEIDPHRIGAMGISGGGLNALYLAAVDQRVKATVVSGFLNTFRDSIMTIPHCIDNFVPGLYQDAEMSDIAGLVAPRALWCENGRLDPIFPVKSFRSALRETKHIYNTMEVPEQCGGEVFSGGHYFHGAGAWPFLKNRL